MQTNDNIPAIVTENLCRHFEVRLKASGIYASVKNFFSPKTRLVKAVNNLNLRIEQGEIIGFLGPNGAGKTTSLKMFSGLLVPTSGEAKILGYTPFERQNEFLHKISLVMGQKQNLWWDLPPIETFEIHRRIYNLTDEQYEARSKELIDMLEIEDCMENQTRRLSLGQRMRCELAVSLLHQPEILFLDEPTIGLDILMQKKIRSFLLDYHRRFKPTILLTSHYMDDVAALAQRVVVIDSGHKVFDGGLKALVERMHPEKIISVVLHHGQLELEQYNCQLITHDSLHYKLLVKPEHIPEMAAKLYSTGQIADLSIEDAPLEDIIGKLFTEQGRNIAETNA